MEQLRGNSKGIMFTLVTVVIVVLLLGEVLTYLYTNTQYSNLGVQAAPGLAAGALYSQVKSGAPQFLQASLADAVYALSAYETGNYGSTPVGNAQYALQSLMTNGTLYGANMVGYMGGYTVDSYYSALQSQAVGKGLAVKVSGANVIVFQNNAGQISATLVESLNVSSPYGMVSYPISANASVPIAGLPNLFGATVGSVATFASARSSAVNGSYAPLLNGGSIYNISNAIANSLVAGSASSHSPYLFAAAPLFVDNSPTPSCIGLELNVTNPQSYILVVYNPASLSGCMGGTSGFAGLVTNGTLTYTPTVPYLIYNSVAIGLLKTGNRYILDSNTLSLYDPTNLQQAVYSGSYYASGFAPSYLDLIGGSQLASSPYGAAPFAGATRLVANMSGGDIVPVPVAVNPLTGGWDTVSLWVQWPGNEVGTMSPFKFGPYQIYLSLSGTGGVALGTSSSNVMATVYWPSTFNTTPWVNIVAGVENNTIPSRTNDTLYIDGVKQNLGLPGSSTVAAAKAVSIGSIPFHGRIADVQVYNTLLTPYQAYSLYASGINAGPTNYTTLAGWWPLNGNPDDYSSYHDNGTESLAGVSWAGLSGYAGDSLDGGSFYHSVVGAVQGISQCYSIGACAWNGNGKINVPVQQGYPANAVQQQAGASLGFVNNTVPASAYFNPAGDNYFEATGIPLTSSTGGDTVSFWMDWVPSSANGTAVYLGSTGVSGSTSGFDGASETSAENKWVNIVVSGSTIYLNGASVGSSSTSLTGIGGTTVYIGSHGGTTSYFPGSLADVQVYNTPLTVAQVGRLYLNNTVPSVNQYLVGWWPLSAGNSGLMNQTFAVTGTYAYEQYGSGNLCTHALGFGLGSVCGIMFLPFGPR